jgi:hypothetical protein
MAAACTSGVNITKEASRKTHGRRSLGFMGSDGFFDGFGWAMKILTFLHEKCRSFRILSLLQGFDQWAKLPIGIRFFDGVRGWFDGLRGAGVEGRRR